MTDQQRSIRWNILSNIIENSPGLSSTPTHVPANCCGGNLIRKLTPNSYQLTRCQNYGEFSAWIYIQTVSFWELSSTSSWISDPRTGWNWNMSVKMLAVKQTENSLPPPYQVNDWSSIPDHFYFYHWSWFEERAQTNQIGDIRQYQRTDGISLNYSSVL